MTDLEKSEHAKGWLRHRLRWLLSFVSDSAQIVSVITPITLVALLFAAHTSIPAAIDQNTRAALADHQAALMVATVVPVDIGGTAEVPAAVPLVTPVAAPPTTPTVVVSPSTPLVANDFVALMAAQVLAPTPAPAPFSLPCEAAVAHNAVPCDQRVGVLLAGGWESDHELLLDVDCVVKHESGWKPRTVTPHDGLDGSPSVGLMQINVGTWGPAGFDQDQGLDATYNVRFARTEVYAKRGFRDWSSAYEYVIYDGKRRPACGIYKGAPPWQQ